MFTIISNTVKESNKEHGFITALIALIFLLGIAFGLVSGCIWIAMLLWNGVLVALFPAVGTITFWQMWGLYLLLDILVKPTSNNSNRNE
jgi:hypothetical protein